MQVKRIVLSVIIPLAAGLAVFLGVMIFLEADAVLASVAPILHAPVLATEAELAGREGEIAWFSGRLWPGSGDRLLTAPLSRSLCLYYRSERWLGGWEEDSDGDDVRVWTLVDSDEEALPLALRIGTSTLPVETEHSLYENLEPGADFVKSADGNDYKHREYCIPAENRAWVLGRLEKGGIRKTERGTVLSLVSAESVMGRMKGEPLIIIFFSVLCFLGGLGIFLGFLAWRLMGKHVLPPPRDIAAVLAAAAYFWTVAGSLLFSLSIGSLLPAILIGLMSSVMFGAPLVAETANGKPFPTLFSLAACLGLVVPGALLFYDSFHAVSSRPLPFLGGMTLFAAALALFSVYNFFIVPRLAQTGKRRS